MFFAGFIILRILFIASMVFVIGYVFGSFSKSILLTRLTKIAVILTIVLFVFTGILSARFGGWRHWREGNRICRMQSPAHYLPDSTHRMR